MSSVPPPRSRASLFLHLLPWVVAAVAGVVALRRPASSPPPVPATPSSTAGAPSAEQPAAVPGAAHIATSPLAASSPISPIPEHIDLDPRKVALGRRLFHDKGLSRDKSIACASCHDIPSGGDDGRAVSTGIGGAQGALNAPTVLNSAFNFRQFWDGRARSLEEQVDGPIQHPAEMGMEWKTLLEQLAKDEGYAAAFVEAYGGPPTQEHVKDAIASFERSLITPGCAFDRYLLGDENALSSEAKAGYELFVSIGCVTCHQGVNTGGNMFQPLGKMGGDYFATRDKGVSKADLGRFNVTGDERDRFIFKVPTLRNVELTAPYFHDGSIVTLEEAVQVMGHLQLGEDLEPSEVAEIVAFLRSLTGTLPADH